MSMGLSLPTHAKIKTLSNLIPAIASAIAIIIAAVKPSGTEEAAAAAAASRQGYELVSKELNIQHDQMIKMDKKLTEISIWLGELRDHENAMIQYYVAPKYGVVVDKQHVKTSSKIEDSPAELVKHYLSENTNKDFENGNHSYVMNIKPVSSPITSTDKTVTSYKRFQIDFSKDADTFKPIKPVPEMPLDFAKPLLPSADDIFGKKK